MTDAQTASDLVCDGASCRVYRDAPAWGGRRTAAIGDFRCNDVASGAGLLDRAATQLRSEGYEALIGPMNGDTWHRYRVVTETDGSPPFLMEPVSGPHDKAAFEASGFLPISGYVSTRASLRDAIGTDAPAQLDGVSISAWDGRDAQSLIGRLFDMSAGAFSRNAFFKPIAKAEFLEIYRPLVPAIEPRLVLFAHDHAGTLVGFLFGVLDPVPTGREPCAILKTYASGRRGVGRVLADTFHRAARDLGCTDVIHALMHEDNVSLERSGRHSGRVFRRYALMGKVLA